MMARRQRLAKLGVAALLAALLAGCGGLRSDKVDQVYVLRVAAGSAPGADAIPGVLRVARPEVGPGLDTSYIVVTRAGNELDFIAGSRWGENLPKVLAAFAAESLARSGLFQIAVGTAPGPVQGNFEVLLTARHFEAEYPAGGGLPQARVTFDCVMTSALPRRVLGRCDAEAVEAAADNRVGEIVAALERAAQRAIAEVGTKAATLARDAVRK